MKSNRTNHVFNKYPANKRLYRELKPNPVAFNDYEDDSCVFGMAYSGTQFSSIDHFPQTTKGVYSYYANDSLELIKLIADLGINEQLEYLSIGHQFGNQDINYKDYTELSLFMSSIQFSSLKKFEYGEDRTNVNGDKYFPYLGNIVLVVENMPNLNDLFICGNFQFDKAISHNKLKHIEISTYWVTDNNVGVVSCETLNNILNSEFENLEKFSLELETVYSNIGDSVYTFNDNFFSNKLSNLRAFALSGNFVSGTKELILQNLKDKVETIDIDRVIEK